MDPHPRVLHVVYSAPLTGDLSHLLCGDAKDNSSCNHWEGMRFSFYLSQTSAAPSIKADRAQRIADDMTP